VRVAAAEDAAGNDKQVVLNRPRDKLSSRAAGVGHLREDVERAAVLTLGHLRRRISGIAPSPMRTSASVPGSGTVENR